MTAMAASRLVGALAMASSTNRLISCGPASGSSVPASRMAASPTTRRRSGASWAVSADQGRTGAVAVAIGADRRYGPGPAPSTVFWPVPALWGRKRARERSVVAVFGKQIGQRFAEERRFGLAQPVGQVGQPGQLGLGVVVGLQGHAVFDVDGDAAAALPLGPVQRLVGRFGKVGG